MHGLVYQRIANALHASATCEASGNIDWRDKWRNRLDAIERDILPSGSGFDSGSQIDRDSTNKRIVIDTAFHHMNENGYYDGWTHHKVIITPCLSHGFELRITGRDRNAIKEYIADCFYHVLRQEYAWPQ